MILLWVVRSLLCLGIKTPRSGFLLVGAPSTNKNKVTPFVLRRNWIFQKFWLPSFDVPLPSPHPVLPTYIYQILLVLNFLSNYFVDEFEETSSKANSYEIETDYEVWENEWYWTKKWLADEEVLAQSKCIVVALAHIEMRPSSGWGRFRRRPLLTQARESQPAVWCVLVARDDGCDVSRARFPFSRVRSLTILAIFSGLPPIFRSFSSPKSLDRKRCNFEAEFCKNRPLCRAFGVAVASQIVFGSFVVYPIRNVRFARRHLVDGCVSANGVEKSTLKFWILGRIWWRKWGAIEGGLRKILKPLGVESIDGVNGGSDFAEGQSEMDALRKGWKRFGDRSMSG